MWSHLHFFVNVQLFPSYLMQVFLRKLGNSTGLTFPPALLRDLGLVAGQVVTLEIGRAHV